MNVNETKSKLKELLQQTDYAVLSDVLLDNKDDFLAFRTMVRQYLTDENFLTEMDSAGVNFLDQLVIPEPVWTEPEETPAE